MTPYILTALAAYICGVFVGRLSIPEAYRIGWKDGYNSQIEDTNVRRDIL